VFILTTTRGNEVETISRGEREKERFEVKTNGVVPGDPNLIVGKIV
jgi:hypothetical protein